eukprot:Opistho-2@63129
MLSVAAIISLILGMREDPRTGWIEGTAILAAVLLVVFVAAINDYQKEIQFRKLNAKNEAREIKVVRNGEQMQVPIAEILVGDVMELATGDILSADGVFVDGHTLKCDESGATGESDTIKKGLEDDPFFLSGTQVMEGVGKMLVVAVGPHSFNGKTLMSLRVESEDTPLQQKLEALAETIAYFGIITSTITLGVLCSKHVVLLMWGGEEFDSHVISAFVKYIITAITMLVVAVPEGLPLAVTMALAFSTMKMLEDHNLVRHLDACETMGGATNICSDKTGTLTQNKMSVVQGNVAGVQFEDAGISAKLRDRLPGAAVTSLSENIAINSTAYEVVTHEGKKDVVGSKTEVALLQFADAIGLDYRNVRTTGPKTVHLYPFSSKDKMMGVVIQKGDKHRLYVKGASEIVLARCSHILDASGNAVAISAEARAACEQQIETMATQALRTICLAYVDLKPRADYESMPAEGLIITGIVGIQDPVRPEVPDAVRRCQKAGIKVRMVTGDNITTAINIAKKCGIYAGGLAMEGPAFRKLTDKELEDVVPNLEVLARSSPTDKQILVRKLKEMGEIVAVTGDGTNDGPALKLAHVGFSMGITGTEVAKEASDIVLMDDNFSSIVAAVSWGRNVYDSIRKFLQFQLTVNIAAVALAFVGSITDEHGESPLKPVQLLWVNLIMDTMAALALATESPTPELLDRKPYGKTEGLITPMMWRNIIGQSIFQMFVNFGLLYYGHIAFGVPHHSVKHLTLFFNTFVMCQLFNEINARKIHGELNVFKGILSNGLFIGVMAFTLIMQYLIVQFGGTFVGTVPLTNHEWLMCIGIGALGIPVGFFLRLVPVARPPPPPVGKFSARRKWAAAINTVKTQESIVSFLRKPTKKSLSMSMSRRMSVSAR